MSLTGPQGHGPVLSLPPAGSARVLMTGGVFAQLVVVTPGRVRSVDWCARCRTHRALCRVAVHRDV